MTAPATRRPPVHPQRAAAPAEGPRPRPRALPTPTNPPLADRLANIVLTAAGWIAAVLIGVLLGVAAMALYLRQAGVL
ncbi:hypothetical protein [Amycolatopsis thermoflava]|uniref:hypothetical protein n=1 Tax=Amycolatopsis thermoflava TaxID=84480 RepID=UPI003F4A6E92